MRLNTLRLAVLLAIGCSGDPAKNDPAPGTDTSPVDTDTDTTDAAIWAGWSCEDPQPILQPDGKTPTGFVRCADGVTDRVESVTCNPPAERVGDTCPSDFTGCRSDADCTDGVNGRCDPEKFSTECSCSYGCATDADCPDGWACLCAGVNGLSGALPVCVLSSCDTSDDCGELACSFDDALCHDTYAPGRIGCRTEADQCIQTEECDVEGKVDDCGISTDGSWVCKQTDYCGDGRPFLVDGAQQVAPLVADRAWAEGRLPEVGHLPADVRAALARSWARAGQDEHASIASFARFTLQLLALGAPPELLAATQDATQDEVRHAQRCFALAGAYAGRPVGPGPLDTSGALAQGMDPLTVAAGVIAEACVGETLAAAFAAEAAGAAEDPVVRATLEQIAAEEQRHAVLGWRFMRWWLGQATPAERAAAGRLMGDTLDQLEALPLREEPPGLRRHGRLGQAERARLRSAVLAQVLRPAAEALLSEPRSGRAGSRPTAAAAAPRSRC